MTSETKINEINDHFKLPIYYNDKKVKPNTYCVEGSKCIVKYDGYWAMCLPYCEQSVISSCCNDESGCEGCDEIPTDGNCKNNTTINKNTIWKKIKNINSGCFYPGNGKMWYDDGGACSEAMCKHNGGHWYEGSSYEKCIKDGYCNTHHNTIRVSHNIDNLFEYLSEKDRYSLKNDLTLTSFKCDNNISIRDDTHTYI